MRNTADKIPASEPISHLTFSLLRTPAGLLTLASSAAGLVRILLPGPSAESPESRLRLLYPQAALQKDDRKIRDARDQLQEYFQGNRRDFHLPLDLRGTPFQQRVWSLVSRVPYGETRTYGEIAGALNAPGAVRAVGSANGANPIPIIIPCHRIIGAGGQLTGYGGGLKLKRLLLDLEQGVQTLFPGSGTET